MKYRYVFRILTIVSFFFIANFCFAQPVLKDSVIISFNEQTRMVIYGTDRREIEKLSQYDFNRLIRDVLQKLDSVSPASGISRDWVDGGVYLKNDSVRNQKPETPSSPAGGRKTDTSEEHFDRTGQRAIVKVTKTVREEDGFTEVVTDTVWVDRSRKWVRRSPRQGVDLKLGLNMYGEKDAGRYDPESFDLRPGGSRYVSLGIIRSFPVVKGRKSNFFMDLGIDISWYNLMFEGNNIIRKENNEVAFPTLVDKDENEVNLRRSKLVAPHVNLSLMPTFAFAGSVISHVSAGVYAGHRIGGYHASRPYGERKSRISSDYHMNDLRYGMAFELGIRSFPDLFVNYDINALFEAGKGPHVRMLSFGLKI